MFKGLIVSIGLLFLLTSEAYSMIGQAESFQISTDNIVSLPGVKSSAIGSNYVIVGQNSAVVCGGANFTGILQSEAGILNQAASVVGLSAKLTSTQEGKLNGQQVQNAGAGSSLMTQNKVIELTQNIDKKGGTGGILAGQTGIIGQVQISVTRDGTSGNADFSGMSQFDGLAGMRGSNAAISKILTINTGN